MEYRVCAVDTSERKTRRAKQTEMLVNAWFDTALGLHEGFVSLSTPSTSSHITSDTSDWIGAGQALKAGRKTPACLYANEPLAAPRS